MLRSTPKIEAPKKEPIGTPLTYSALTYSATEHLGLIYSPDAAQIYEEVANSFKQRGELREACRFYEAAVLAWSHSQPYISQPRGSSEDLAASIRAEEAKLKCEFEYRASHAYHQLCEIHLELNLPTLAVHFKEKEIEFARRCGSFESSHLAERFEELGNLLAGQEYYREARQSFERAFSERFQDANFNGIANIKNLLNQYALAKILQDDIGANQVLTRVFMEIEQIGTGKLKPALDEFVGYLGAFSDRLDPAANLELLGVMKGLVKKAGPVADYHSITLERLTAFNYARLGDYSHATQSQATVVSLLTSRLSPDDPETISAREELARLFFFGKDPHRAERLATENLALLRKAKNTQDGTVIVEPYLSVIELRLQNCKLIDAENLVCELLEMGIDMQSISGVRLLLSRAGISAAKGFLDQAQALLEESHRICASLKNDQHSQPRAQQLTRVIYSHQINIALHRGEHEQAEALLSEMEQQVLATEDPENVAQLITLRAKLLEVQGDASAAEPLRRNALDLVSQRPEFQGTVVEAAYLEGLAGNLMIVGNVDEPIALLERARTILDESGRGSHISKVHLLQALEAAYDACALSEQSRQCELEIQAIMAELSFLNDGSLFLGGDEH